MEEGEKPIVKLGYSVWARKFWAGNLAVRWNVEDGKSFKLFPSVQVECFPNPVSCFKYLYHDYNLFHEFWKGVEYSTYSVFNSSYLPSAYMMVLAHIHDPPHLPLQSPHHHPHSSPSQMCIQTHFTFPCCHRINNGDFTHVVATTKEQGYVLKVGFPRKRSKWIQIQSVITAGTRRSVSRSAYVYSHHRGLYCAQPQKSVLPEIFTKSPSHFEVPSNRDPHTRASPSSKVQTSTSNPLLEPHPNSRHPTSHDFNFTHCRHLYLPWFPHVAPCTPRSVQFHVSMYPTPLTPLPSSSRPFTHTEYPRFNPNSFFTKNSLNKLKINVAPIAPAAHARIFIQIRGTLNHFLLQLSHPSKILFMQAPCRFNLLTSGTCIPAYAPPTNVSASAYSTVCGPLCRV